MTGLARVGGCVAGLALAGVVAASTVGTGAGATVAKEPPTNPVSWMSTGDSYSSGEGIAGTGADDVCAQSRQAYGPLAATVLADQRDWDIEHVVFNACTGAVAGDFYVGPAGNGRALEDWAGDLNGPRDGRYEVITMTFGGNDLGFSDILKDCLGVAGPAGEDGGAPSWQDVLGGQVLGSGCDVARDDLEAAVDRLMTSPTIPIDPPEGSEGLDAVQVSLPEFWDQVADDHLAPGGVLLVVGYPDLFAPVDEWPGWRGDRCEGIHWVDTEMLNDLSGRLDGAMAEAASERRRVHYLSQRDLYRGGDSGTSHSLCTREAEWLNGLSVGFWDGTLGRGILHSFHPNEIGHVAAAEVVATGLDELLGLEASAGPSDPAPSGTASPGPTTASTTTAPPLQAGPTYEIGEPFEDRCGVAWPAAPQRSTRGIVMRMTCQGVPGQFLFVDVSHPDPDLDIGPSTGFVAVTGEVVDIADSEAGFRVLVVAADEVAVPD